VLRPEKPGVALEPEAPALDLEQRAHGLPARSFAAHALAEAALVEDSAAHLAERAQHLLGALGIGDAQTLLEHGSYLGCQPQEHQESRARSRGGGAFEDLAHLRVVEARDEGRERDADLDPGLSEAPQGLEARGSSTREGFNAARVVVVREGDRERDAGAAAARQTRQELDVAAHERALGDDADRVAEFVAHLETGACQAVGRLQRLIAIRDAGERDRNPASVPAATGELPAQERGRVGLHHDLRVEIRARAEVEELVRGPRVAVSAGVLAAAVGIEAELEADVGAVVGGEDRVGLFLEDLDRDRRRLLEPLHVRGMPGIGWVGNAARGGGHGGFAKETRCASGPPPAPRSLPPRDPASEP
jgi:hypothetical protein